MRFVPLSEFEKEEEQKGFRFVPIEEVAAAETIDYSDAATAMQGTTPSAGTRGIIQRVGEFLRPAPKALLDQPYTPEERQAEIDRRLSYGAGPIRPEVLQAADRLRSGEQFKFFSAANEDRVKRVAAEMERRGEKTGAQIVQDLNTQNLRDAAAEFKAQEWRSVGEWAADTLSAAAQGAVLLPQLVTNIVAPGGSLAESMRETQKELQAQESDVLKAQREVLRRRVETEDGFFGKYWATVQELVSNPALSLSEAVKQVPMFLGVVGAARLGGAAGAGGVGLMGRAAPTVALGEAISGGAISSAARVAGTTAGGAGASMVMAGGDAAGSTYEELTDPKRTPLSEWKKNSDYQQLVQEKVAAGASQGEASKQAIEELAVSKARMSALITAPLGLLGFMGAEAAIASRGLGQATKEALTPRGVAKLLLKENVGQQLEEGGTQLGANIITGTVNTQKDLLQGVPEAMATAAVTSAPFAAAGAYSQYQEAAAGAPRDLAVEDIASRLLSGEFSDPRNITPQETVQNFTPPDSPTRQAGLVDIVVPLPGAAEINPSTEQQFGLDKLRMGGVDVGTAGVPGGLAAAGGIGGGGLAGGSLGAAGPGVLAAAGGGDGVAQVLGAGDRPALPAGGAAGEQAAGVAVGGEPLTWTGRAKTGYANEQDAQQAMATASTVIDTRQTHDWRVEPMGNGRFQIVGYQKETNLGTQTPQAQQAQAPGAAATGQAAGLAQGGAGGITATARPAVELSDTERAGLRLAPTAPVRELKVMNEQLDKQLGVTFSPVRSADLTDSQRLASAVARLMGKTLTVVHQETGAGALPNGMINSVGGKHLFVADDADDAPLAVTVHEAYHGLPEQQRKALNTALLDLFRQDRKDKFLDEFSYTPDKFEEEAPAMMVQAISKREDFWQELRVKMGNKEFGEVAKTIIAKLGDILTGAKKQYGEDFVNKYITDVAKARDLLTTAYADAMKAQGLQPDVEFTSSTGEPVVASARSRIGMDFKDVIKRTPELQAAAAKVQAGEMTAAEYDRLVNEYKPVEPYTSVPPPATADEAIAALKKTNSEKEGSPTKDTYYGRAAQTLKAGDPVGLRLDIPSYSKTGTWVVTVHEPRKNLVAGGAGTRIGYESVASATDVQFSINEKGAIGIASGKEKNTIATMEGKWKPTTPAEAKLKADQALKSKDWVQVGMDPERHSYFYNRKTMEPVVSASEVIQIGPLVLAKNPTYGKKSEFMFSTRVREPIKVSDYNPKADNFNNQRDMPALLSESVPAETIAAADGFVEKYFKERQPVSVSPEDRLRAEILLKPRMDAAEQAKPEYDQKILNIAARTGAAGQMLAPIKGMKRAAEKLAVEEKFQVDNIKDLLRSTIVVDSYADAPAIVDEIRKEFDVVRIKDRANAGVLGDRVEVADRQKFGGYADILINIRMPNGTIGEIQINTPAMLAAKDGQGHKLYEAAREQPEGSPLRSEIYDAMRGLYDAAFEAANLRQPSAQARKEASDIGAPRAGSELTGTSSSPESASLKTEPSGNVTYSSPEKSATNLLPGGKEAGTFIEPPDAASVPQTSQAQTTKIGGTQVAFSRKVKKEEAKPEEPPKPEPVGQYTYITDSRGRIVVSGDVARIRFLTRKLANGTVVADGVRFKGEDKDVVLRALGDEPKVNPDIAKAVAEQLGLTPQELASTSLEFQTGMAGDRAFVAPLQGTIPEVIKFLEQRRRASGLQLLQINKPEHQAILAKLVAAETMAAIRASGNALEWYDETIAKTLAMAAVKYPELGTDVNAQMFFRVAMAITSQGLNVENNLNFTMRQYDAFRKQGKFPEVGEGEDAQAMKGNFALANDLLAEMGPDMLRRFLVTPFTVAELRSAGFSPEGELADEMVLGSSVFGPKIGFGFYSNLNGNFEPVTMDMWFMRTIGRLTGSLRAFSEKKFVEQMKRFRAALDERGTDGVFAGQFDPALVERARTDNDAAIELARQVDKAHEKDYKINRAAFDAKTRKKSELVYSAGTMVTSLDKPKDAPANGGERRHLREIVRQAVGIVEQAYGQRIPPAAMQALIWYPEQELYKALGVKLSVTSQDYAGATQKLLLSEGYDAAKLRAAAESGSAGARRKNGQANAGGAQAAGQAAGQSGPLKGTERARFLRQRYERTELGKERVEPKRRGIVFEVAPDPNNERLTTAWRNLSQDQRREISERVAREIVPRVLKEFDTDGIITMQVGSYLDDTNPSFTLLIDKGDPVEIAKILGHVLAQDSMMVISPREMINGEKNSALVIEVGQKTAAEIEAIYNKLREIEVNGEKPVGGQSYANGGMTILNYSNVPTPELAVLVDQKLNKAYSILTRDVYAAFPSKQEYDYASAANDGRGSRKVLRQRARDLRAEATAAVEQELRDSGVQFSQRARPDEAGAGRDRVLGQEEVRGQVTPSYGTPRDGAASAVGYHYSTQPRTSLSSAMYGAGLRGAEMARLEGADPRLKQRIYFYIDRGTGVNPEAGVGGQAHRVNLQNLYDADEDALRLQRDAGSFNAFESAVIDAGFDGYMVRDAGPSGNAVLLGQHSVPVEQLGAQGRMQGEQVAAARERVLSDVEKIANNKMLPAGQVSGTRWAELVSRAMPDVYERLADSPVWQSNKPMYRSELARELRAQPMFSNRRLPKVSPQSALNADITAASDNLARYVKQVGSGAQLPKLTIGRLPHVLNMLGARTQDFDIATSIVKKVFIEKHKDDLPDITPKQLIEAIYRPAMVLKSKDGNPREFELVLPITNDKGAVIVPIKVSVDKTDPTGAVMSIYAKGVSISGGKTNEQVLMKRINDGNLLYLDPGLAKQALTGRKAGDAKLNGSFVSWPGVWPKLEKMISERRVKTDVNLMRWIGDNYKPSSSPQGWQDAPAFSQRARAVNTEVPDQDVFEEFGVFAENRIDAERAWADGDYVFAVSEMDEEPAPVTSPQMLAAYTPDQLMIIRARDWSPSEPAVPDQAEVASLFRDLQDARGLGRVRALERVDAHPMAETIRRIDEEFMDILERLDDAGLVKINCK